MLFFKHDGLIYRRWTPPGRDDEMGVEQLVLPKVCQKAVLELAHEIPLAGHMGKEKTSRRILQRLYWPTLYKDVANFCRSCERCQQSTKQGVPKSPLISLPIIVLSHFKGLQWTLWDRFPGAGLETAMYW